MSTACSASAKAVGCAQRLLATDAVDAVLVGGVDALSQTTLRGFHSLQILSPVFCRPLSRERRGINIGEGAAYLLLEREGDAAVRLLGVGESSDAHHMSAPDPTGEGARTAMAAALAQAGLPPGEVDYINAHSPGTRLNDLSEGLAVTSLFGGRVPVASTKGYTGHLLGAGGATEAVFAIVAIEQGWIPRSVGADPVDADLGPERPDRPPGHARAATSSATRSRSAAATSACCSARGKLSRARACARNRVVDAGLSRRGELAVAAARVEGADAPNAAVEAAAPEQPAGEHGGRRRRAGQRRRPACRSRGCASSSAPRSAS